MRKNLSLKLVGWLVLTLVLMSAASLAIYHRVAVLEPAGSQYMSQLTAAVKQLHIKTEHFAKASDTFFFDGEPVNAAVKLQSLGQLATEITALEKAVTSFRASARTLPEYHYPLLSPTYQNGLIAKKDSEATANQITEVTSEYKTLLVYLEKYYRLCAVLESELEYFNSVDNLDVLADLRWHYWELSQTLAQQADGLAAVTPPRGFEKLHAQTVLMSKNSAAAFTQLADSYAPPIDSAISAAATRLEEITKENEALTSTLYELTLQNSPVVHSASDLPETTDGLGL